MRSTTRIAAVIGLTFAASVVQHAGAETYRSDSFGFSIDVPEGWVRVPDDIVQKSKSLLYSRKAQARIILDAAFQQPGSDRWFDQPYVVIQVCPYLFIGSSRPPTEAEFPAVIRSIVGADAQREWEEVASDEVRDAVSDTRTGEFELDREGRRYRLPVEIDAPAIGTIRGEFTGFFGRHAIVQVMFYDLADTWGDSAAERQQLAGSFRFDAPAAYPAGPKRAPVDGRENVGRRWSSTIVFAIVVFIVVGVVCVIALRRQSADEAG